MGSVDHRCLFHFCGSEGRVRVSYRPWYPAFLPGASGSRGLAQEPWGLKLEVCTSSPKWCVAVGGGVSCRGEPELEERAKASVGESMSG